MQKFCCFMMLAILTLFGNQTMAQPAFDKLEEEMAFYADVMMNAEHANHRTKGAAVFDSLFSLAIHEPGSFEHPFDSLKWIIKISPIEEEFRIFSWRSDAESNKYKAYLQKRDGSVITFQDRRPLLGSAEKGNFASDKWYGALYFGIEPFKMGNKTAYVLLGFDGHDEVTNKKIADIMTLEGDEVNLGAPIFIRKVEGGKEEKSRVIIEYSDSAVGMMRFDRERNMLIYDNMVTVFAGGPNMGGVPVPHGSYSAYELKGGKWKFMDKIFNETTEKTTSHKPILENQNKDILGRPKKG